jgi:hypothetical protein
MFTPIITSDVKNGTDGSLLGHSSLLLSAGTKIVLVKQ